MVKSRKILLLLVLCLGLPHYCESRGGGGGRGGGGRGGSRGMGSRSMGSRGMGSRGRVASRSGARASQMRPASGARRSPGTRSAAHRGSGRPAGRTAGRTAGRSHGYGHHYGRGGRGYGHGWGHGWYGGSGFGWGWGWGLGFGFGFWIPSLLISSLYAGYYPYWGYGLGYGNQLVVLAQDNKWDEIRDMLEQKLNELNDQLANSQSLSQTQIDEIQQQINRIEAHLDGITQPQQQAQEA